LLKYGGRHDLLSRMNPEHGAGFAGKWTARYLPEHAELHAIEECNSDVNWDELLDDEQALEGLVGKVAATEAKLFSQTNLLRPDQARHSPFTSVTMECGSGSSIKLSSPQGDSYRGRINIQATPHLTVRYATLSSRSSYGYSMVLLVPAADGRLHGVWSRYFWGVNDRVTIPHITSVRFVLKRTGPQRSRKRSKMPGVKRNRG
jgi:hypothetical protein